MAAIAWKNYVFEGAATAIIAGTAVTAGQGAASPKLAERTTVAFAGQAITFSFANATPVDIISFLDVANLGDNYPVAIEDSSIAGHTGAGIVTDFVVTRHERANGNVDIHLIFDQRQFLGPACTVHWTNIPAGAAFGALFPSPLYRWARDGVKQGVNADWAVEQDDIAAVNYTEGGQVNTSLQPQVFRRFVFGISLKNNRASYGAAELGDPVNIPAPTPGAGMSAPQDDFVTGQPPGAGTIATWAGVLNPGQRYQLDYQGALTSPSSDRAKRFTLTAVDGPLQLPIIRGAVEFVASGTDLVIGITAGTSGDIDFELIALRPVNAGETDEDLISIIRHVGKARPLIVIPREGFELVDIERLAVYGFLEQIDRLQHVGGPRYDRSFVLREAM